MVFHCAKSCIYSRIYLCRVPTIPVYPTHNPQWHSTLDWSCLSSQTELLCHVLVLSCYSLGEQNPTESNINICAHPQSTAAQTSRCNQVRIHARAPFPRRVFAIREQLLELNCEHSTRAGVCPRRKWQQLLRGDERIMWIGFGLTFHGRRAEGAGGCKLLVQRPEREMRVLVGCFINAHSSTSI